MVEDIVFIGFLLTAFFFINKKWAKSRGFSYSQTSWLFALWLYHLAISLVFYRYILVHGGDSWRYWNMLPISDGTFAQWWDYFGTGTYFMYWINYPFSQMAGLGYLSGTFLYASISYLGFLMAFYLVNLSFPKIPKSHLLVAVFILFLPNAHFWTAGIGKEALLWLGLMLVLVGVHQFPNRWIFIAIGLMLSLMIRPIQGLILTSSALMALPFHGILKPYRKKLIPISALLILLIVAYRYIKGSLIYGFNLEWMGEILDWQTKFLASFGGASSVNMNDYNWFEKIGTILFRPFIWEVNGFWTFAAGLENTLTILFFILGLWSLYQLRGATKIPLYLWVVVIYGVFLSLLFSLTLNNLGIMMRMKSIYFPFFIIFVLHLYNESVRITK